ncbi:Uncharacterized protein QTN25_003564 [Entamoeba marina]
MNNNNTLNLVLGLSDVDVDNHLSNLVKTNVRANKKTLIIQTTDLAPENTTQQCYYVVSNHLNNERKMECVEINSDVFEQNGKRFLIVQSKNESLNGIDTINVNDLSTMGVIRNYDTIVLYHAELMNFVFPFIERMLYERRNVIASGVYESSRCSKQVKKELFSLIPLADNIEIVKPICLYCNSKALYTLNKSNEKEPIYVCRKCYYNNRRPTSHLITEYITINKKNKSDTLKPKKDTSSKRMS